MESTYRKGLVLMDAQAEENTAEKEADTKSITCEECNQKIEYPEDTRYVVINCPHCGQNNHL